MKRHFQEEPEEIPLEAQAWALAGRCPSAWLDVQDDRLLARFVLRPKAFSRSYLMELAYKLNEVPRTFVSLPVLADFAKNRKVPHLWSQADSELCLFLNQRREWKSGFLLADTVVPWASEWLFHFEHWEVTGEWDGGGTVHN